jgi:hypothetical protein
MDEQAARDVVLVRAPRATTLPQVSPDERRQASRTMAEMARWFRTTGPGDR